jgi:DNA-binding IclR family transcriptional regulator
MAFSIVELLPEHSVRDVSPQWLGSARPTGVALIHSVLKAIDVLKQFSPAEPRLSLGEISARLELPKSTTHNLLNTLAARGLIEKSGDGRYALGREIIALSQAVCINVELRDVAAPLLRELSDVCHESVYLTVLDGDFALYLYAVESSRRLRARTAVGDRAHLHCTGVGKAMLSHLPRPEVEAIAARSGLPRFTETTITDLDGLHRELEETRRRGYSIDRGEHEEGSFCIGAPIFNRYGQALAACSLSGADPEIVGDRLPELAAHVLYTAQEISRSLGFIPNRSAAVVAAPVAYGNGAGRR